MADKKVRCDECRHPRKQCEQCREHEEFAARLADILSEKLASALAGAARR